MGQIDLAGIVFRARVRARVRARLPLIRSLSHFYDHRNKTNNAYSLALSWPKKNRARTA